MMEVEKEKGENNVEKEKYDKISTKEEPMEAEPIKEKTITKHVGNFAENASVGGLSADVKQEPDTEDDDPVIHEIPVYLSKSIPKLYLFQVLVLTSHKT